MRALAAGLILALAAAHAASARENYQGSMKGQCVTHGATVYNVIANVTAPNWSVTDLQYTFTPGPQPASVDVNARVRYFSVAPGTHTVNLGNPGHQATYTIVAPKCYAVGTEDRYTGRTDYNTTYTSGLAITNGMTWSVLQTNPVNGTSRVGCKVGCDPHKGDTPCTTPLPLLCVKKSGTGFPLPPPAGFNNNDSYNKWLGGVIATTAPTAAPATLADANNACAAAFGTDWRVAQFHDGEGWAFWAYGAAGDPTKRFRVHIKDQPANCWK